MLQVFPSSDVGRLTEQNTDPVVNKAGLLARSRIPGIPTLEQELDDDAYIIEDDYGCIWSSDFFRERMALLAGPPHSEVERFSNHGWLHAPFRQVPRRFVTTRSELQLAMGFLDAAAAKLYPNSVVVYRGQTQEHYLPRSPEERMRLFGSVDVLEPSLRPSGSRRKEISSLASAVWAQMVQDYVANARTYAPAHRYLETGEAWPFTTERGRHLLLAFAQHYGLPTPALDVTSDIRVALWFALFNLTGSGAMRATPAQGGHGVVYVLAAGKQQYFSEETFPTYALRPERQRGGFLASNWGNRKNRVSRYLVGAIYFSHALRDELQGDLPSAQYLFPGPEEDGFVQRIQRVAWHEHHGSVLLSEIADHVYWFESDPPSGLEVPLDDRGDPRTDAELERTAETGDAEAAYRLAIRRSALEDSAGAIRWSRIAAERGHLEGAAMLGSFLTEQGDAEGEQWTRLAASAEQPDALNNLGALYALRGNVEEAAKWYERAANRGNSKAAYNLGTLFQKTGRTSEAEHWLTVSANLGDEDAANNLGKILYERADLKGAEHWFRIAASGGVGSATYNLGLLCRDLGRVDEAIEWLRRAVAAGDPDAPYHLDRLRRAPILTDRDSQVRVARPQHIFDEIERHPERFEFKESIDSANIKKISIYRKSSGELVAERHDFSKQTD